MDSRERPLTEATPPPPEEVERVDRSAPSKEGWLAGTPAQLAQAVLFGLAFGFLLQKGGVAKFDILAGVLLLEEFTVIKVMLSAVLVGMVGAYALERLGVIELQVKETILGANVLGGLLFGVGFGLLAYCPGTDAAAVGQGNYDALVGMAGMVAGSYLFALASGWTGGTVSTWGRLGKVTLPQVARLRPAVFLALAAPVLVAVLVLLELADGR